MKWQLYLSRKEWEDIKAALKERAPKDPKTGRPCCEYCGKVNGKLKRSKKSGYLVPHWCHAAHIHGAEMQSKDPADYLFLCDSCHMWYDRHPDDAACLSRRRVGYTATTTDDLVRTMHGVGLDIWEGESGRWLWRLAGAGGEESTPAECVAVVVARLHRLVVEQIEVRA
jgi:hypothetical protein